MKKRRHAKILELINSHDIETQEELQAFLLKNGYEVTQATISRDIKELRLVKDLSDKGRYIYSTGKKNNNENARRTGGIFGESIINVEYAQNIVCIKGLPMFCVIFVFNAHRAIIFRQSYSMKTS